MLEQIKDGRTDLVFAYLAAGHSANDSADGALMCASSGNDFFATAGRKRLPATSNLIESCRLPLIKTARKADTEYAVQQREREVAIRIALGATPGMILQMFLRQGGLVLAIGIIGGLFAAAAVAKTLASQPHGVPPFDLETLVGACAVMTVIGLLAILWPARRAALQNPMSALNEN